LIDQKLAIVFYDLTTIRTEGGSEQSENLRHFGHAKEGGIVRLIFPRNFVFQGMGYEALANGKERRS